MDNLISSAERLIKKYHRDFFIQRYNLTAINRFTYHFEFALIKEKQKVKVQVYFGKKGLKVVVQGDQSSNFYKSVYDKINPNLFPAEADKIVEPEIYIGTDESGKGDYFGPLVVAGVLVNKISSDYLKLFGVKDSKELSENAVRRLSNDIKKCEGVKFNVITIAPKKYNELHARIGNVNRILGWAHAKVIENLLDKNSVNEAVSDKFGDEKYIYTSLQEKGKNIKLLQLTKAERFTAVAAASILARDRFNFWFKHEKAKLGFELPKGASDNTEAAAKMLISKIGKNSLKDFVKLHFKNTQKLELNI